MLRRSFLKLAGACVLVPALRWVPVTSHEDELLAKFSDAFAEFMPPDDFMNDSIEQPYMLEVLLRSGKRRHGVIMRISGAAAQSDCCVGTATTLDSSA